MSFTRHRIPAPLSLIVLLACLCTGPARADAYGDVTQLLRNGQRTEALTAAQRYIAEKPRDPQMRFLLGVIQTELDRGADAVQTFTALTQEYPELPEPYNNLAVLLAASGQIGKAREALEMAVRTNPNYAVAHENLGDVYAQLAAQAYSRSVQLDAAHSTAAPKLTLVRQLLTPPSKSGKSP